MHMNMYSAFRVSPLLPFISLHVHVPGFQTPALTRSRPLSRDTLRETHVLRDTRFLDSQFNYMYMYHSGSTRLGDGFSHGDGTELGMHMYT